MYKCPTSTPPVNSLSLDMGWGESPTLMRWKRYHF